MKSDKTLASDYAMSFAPTIGVEQHDGERHQRNRHVEVALNFVDRNYHKPTVRLRDVADVAGLSPAYLDRLLTRETGASFLVHLRRVRLSHARNLLAIPQLSVKQISFTIGYKYVVEFDRHFKRAHGVTPSEWRRGLTAVDVLSLTTKTVNEEQEVSTEDR
jgi:AraC-like DNA-binding protein